MTAIWRRGVRAIATAALAVALTIGMAAPAGAAPAVGVPTKKHPAPLQVLVTNDDGVGAPGIDALVEALRKLSWVKVRVFAPATNQSGTGDTTTPGTVASSQSQTASGYPAVAVRGHPADSVNTALAEEARKKPNVVISGVNQGQNLGALVDASGTVGAARTAARNGIPALAVSQGLGEPPDFASGARAAVTWLREHRGALARRRGEATVENLNVPTCTTGKVRGLVEVPVAPDAENAVDPSDCASTLTNPVDDIQAFTNGYVTLSTLPLD